MTIEEIEHELLVISNKSDNEGAAHSAFSTIYKGYSKFLTSVVSGNLKRMGIYDKQVMNTVINNTFYKLYENPFVFSFPNGAIDDNNFKAWLSTVAKNELTRLLKEYFEGTKSLEIVIVDPQMESEDLDEVIFESVNLKVMNDALNTLSERDKEILLTLYLYYEEGKNTPSKILDLICKIHSTTKENIRKIKQRSEKKIIEFFSQRTLLKPLRDVK